MNRKFRVICVVVLLCTLLANGCSRSGGGWVRVDIPIWALPFLILGGGASGGESAADKEVRVAAYNERMARTFLPGNCQVWWEGLLAQQGHAGEYEACGKAYGELLAFLIKRTPPFDDPRGAVIYELMSRSAAAHPDPETPVRDAENLLAATGKAAPAKALLAASLLRGVFTPYWDSESALAELLSFSEKSVESRLRHWPTVFGRELGKFALAYMPLATHAHLRANNGYVELHQIRAAPLLVRAAEAALPILPDTPRTALALGSVYATMGWSVPDGEKRRQWWDKATVLYAKALTGADPVSAYVALILGTQVAALDAERLQLLRAFCDRYPSVKFREEYLAPPAPGNRTAWEVDFLALPGSPLLPVGGVPLFHTMELMKTVTYWPCLLAGNLSPWFTGAQDRESMCASLFALYGRPAVYGRYMNTDIYYLAWYYGGQRDDGLFASLREQFVPEETAEREKYTFVLQVESAILRKDEEALKLLHESLKDNTPYRSWWKVEEKISPFASSKEHKQ